MNFYRAYKNNQTFPPAGGLGQPGQRETRFTSLKEEISRIRQTTGGMLLFGSVILLSLVNILAILGPWFGWGIGICVIVYSFVFLRAWIARRSMLTMSTELGIVVLVLIVLACWGLVGPGWVASWWLPPCHLGFWAELILVAFHLLVIAALTQGTWAFWAEQVDPNGPTPPRAATHRETLIKPWDPETYGGRYLDEEDDGPALLSSPTFSIDITEQGPSGRTNHTIINDLPELPSFRQFCAHVAQGHITFTEANARDYNVPLDAVVDGQGRQMMMGLRDLRDFALDPARGWITWKNPNEHARGVILSDKFLKILAAIGNVSLEGTQE